MKHYSYLLFMMLVIFTSGCKKKEDDDDSSSSNGSGSTSGITIDSPWQYTIKVDGTTYTKTENDAEVDGVWSNNTELNTWPDSSTNNYNAALYNNISGDTYFEIYRNGHRYVGATAENSEFLHYFDAGSYPYSVENVNGVSIRWVDSNGITWGTDIGTGDQTGSQFTIDQTKEATGYNYSTIKVLSHFNCKLYNGLGQSKTLTDGKYVCKFQNF
jgi:hypothetical protein